MMPDQDIPSPCINQCKLDQSTQTCTGCRRTLEEIRLWSRAGNAEKAQILQRLASLPLIQKEKQCERCGAGFSCGSGGKNGCWCMDLPAVLSVTMANGDCLCPACLQATILTVHHPD